MSVPSHLAAAQMLLYGVMWSCARAIVGDEVPRACAERRQRGLRHVDQVGRVGGEAVADAADAEPGQMVWRSDAALYQSMHDGRDRVVSGALVATIPVTAASPAER